MQLTIQWALPDATKQHRFDLLLDKAKVDKRKAYDGDSEMTDWLIMIWAKNHIRAAYKTGNADPILFNYQITEQ
jgi:hypothetical protein